MISYRTLLAWGVYIWLNLCVCVCTSTRQSEWPAGGTKKIFRFRIDNQHKQPAMFDQLCYSQSQWNLSTSDNSWKLLLKDWYCSKSEAMVCWGSKIKVPVPHEYNESSHNTSFTRFQKQTKQPPERKPVWSLILLQALIHMCSRAAL